LDLGEVNRLIEKVFVRSTVAMGLERVTANLYISTVRGSILQKYPLTQWNLRGGR
jgi:hypothetical protein